MTELKEVLQKEADRLSPKYDTKQALTLPLLRHAQEIHGYITPDIENMVADVLELPPVKIREVVSFYTLYHKKPVGKYRINVCRTMSCWLRGGEEITEYLKKKLGIEKGETTADGLITLDTVECLCVCEIAPMMSVNDRFVGPLTTEKVDEILGELK